MIVKPFDKTLLVLRELPLLEMHQVMGERLRLMFEQDEDVYVFNRLCITGESGNPCSIDHLILTRWGIFIIHNYHVDHILAVDRQNTWTKRDALDHGRDVRAPTEMPREKARDIRTLLNRHARKFMPTTFGVHHYFGLYPIKGFVAVNDSATIQRDQRRRGENVMRQEFVLAETFKVFTEYRVRSEYYWLTRWLAENPSVLSKQATFNIAHLLQTLDLKPSPLSSLLIPGISIENDEQTAGQETTY